MNIELSFLNSNWKLDNMFLNAIPRSLHKNVRQHIYLPICFSKTDIHSFHLKAKSDLYKYDTKSQHLKPVCTTASALQLTSFLTVILKSMSLKH